jgi:hypothetical protein
MAVSLDNKLALVTLVAMPTTISYSVIKNKIYSVDANFQMKKEG